MTSEESFCVYQYLPEGIVEKIREHVTAKQAVDAAYHYTHNVAAMCGITRRVIITDSGDSVVFEWLAGKGVVFPTQQQREQARRDYSK